METFLDQIDADEAGYNWLHTYIKNDAGINVDSIRSSTHHNDGLTVVAWSGNTPKLMFVVIRDMLNRSILIKQVL